MAQRKMRENGFQSIFYPLAARQKNLIKSLIFDQPRCCNFDRRKTIAAKKKSEPGQTR